MTQHRFLRLVLFFVLVLMASPSSAQPVIPLPPAPDDDGLYFRAQTTAFTIVYPSTARPARIVKRFVLPGGASTPYEGVNLYAPSGTGITAGAAGDVLRITYNHTFWGNYALVRTQVNGVTYRVIYGNMASFDVQVGQTVTRGQRLGTSNGHLKLIVLTSQGGLAGFRVKNVADPRPLLRLPGLRIQPTEQNLRLRAAPSTESAILGFVNPWDLLTTTELAYDALLKVGKQNRWITVKRSDGTTAYVAAWFTAAVSVRDVGVQRPPVPLQGMNLDLYSPNGTPQTAPLRGLGFVRLNYNLSFNPNNGTYGNTDVFAAYSRYYPIIKRYTDNGNKVILVFTHQLYGEAQGYNWDTMSASKWQQLTAQFSYYAQQVATQYRGLVYAYQIWNEQDTVPGTSVSAVPVPADQYANMLTSSLLAIRAVDTQALVITGGHVTGTALGVNYAKATLAAMPSSVRPDGIAFHAYGVGPAGSPFTIFGTIDAAIKAWSQVMPGKPLWITEFGVLGREGDESIAVQVTDYARDFLNIISGQYKNAVAAAVWYAYSDGMDNAYGLVRRDGSAREPLYSTFLTLPTRQRRAVG